MSDRRLFSSTCPPDAPIARAGTLTLAIVDVAAIFIELIDILKRTVRADADELSLILISQIVYSGNGVEDRRLGDRRDDRIGCICVG
jgi:hypothetical protein